MASTKKQQAQSLAILTIETLEREFHKNIKRYEEACRDNLFVNAEIAYELARERMSRLRKQYETVIPQLDAETQATYLNNYEETVDRHHKLVIDWRTRNPAASLRPVESPTIHTYDEEETSPTTTRDAAEAATGVVQPTEAAQATGVAQAVDTATIQQQLNLMSIAHLLPRIKITIFEGELNRWRDWWAIFRTLIQKNPSLRTIEKFSRLKIVMMRDSKVTDRRM